MSPNTPIHRIGESLVAEGIITEDQLTIALTEQRKEHHQIGKILVKLGFVSEAVMRDFVSHSYEQDSVDLSKIVPDGEAAHLVPKSLARRHKLLPITWDEHEKLLIVAMADVSNIVALDQIKAAIGGNVTIQPVLGSESEILHAIDNVYGFDFSLDGILHEIETGEIDYQSIAISNDEYSQPLVRLVDVLLADAVKRGASDIHFEPEETFFRIRYRIDGVLQQI
ncbi:MAG: secretion system protein E, partial [Pseudomonadota bacterium]